MPDYPKTVRGVKGVGDGIILFDLVDGAVGPASWAVADWYVDWVNGDDANAGTSPATAVKTVMGGVVSKWGTIAPILRQSTTLHILTSQPLGAEGIILAPSIAGDFNFNIVGTPVEVANVLLATVTPKDRATNQPLEVSSAGQAIGTLRHNLSHGPFGGSYAWKRDTDPVGPKDVMSQPLGAPRPGIDPFIPPPAEVDTWAPGDIVTSRTELPTLNLIALDVLAGAVNSTNINGGVWLQFIHIFDQSGLNGDFSGFTPIVTGAYLTISACVIEPYLVVGHPPTFTNIQNCWLSSGGELYDAGMQAGVVASTALAFIIGQNSSVDGDAVIMTGAQANASTSTLGFVEIDAVGLLTVQAAPTFLAPAGYGGQALWGGGIVMVANGGGLFLVSGGTWAASLFATASLDNSGSGTTYAAGAFTDGIAVTPALLDANDAIFNVNTGSRYAKEQ